MSSDVINIKLCLPINELSVANPLNVPIFMK